MPDHFRFHPSRFDLIPGFFFILQNPGKVADSQKVFSVVPAMADAKASRSKRKKRVLRYLGNSKCRFLLGKTLGSGATSMVKLGLDTKTGKKFALKILFSSDDRVKQRQQVRAFGMETKLLSSINHPNILRLHSVHYNLMYPHRDGSTTPVALLVLELAPGGELMSLLDSHDAFSVDIARAIFCQLLDAVDACHKKGIVHRDLKPQNVLMDAEMVPKIADFGYSRFFPVGTTSAAMSTQVGTTCYMAPEVMEGKYNEKADIWSLGVMLFIFLTGYPPYGRPASDDFWWNALVVSRKPKRFWLGHENASQRKFDPELKDFFNKIFTTPYTQRPPISELRKHPWLDKKKLTQTELKAALTRSAGEIDFTKIREQMRKIEAMANMEAGSGGAWRSASAFELFSEANKIAAMRARTERLSEEKYARAPGSADWIFRVPASVRVDELPVPETAERACGVRAREIPTRGIDGRVVYARLIGIVECMQTTGNVARLERRDEVLQVQVEVKSAKGGCTLQIEVYSDGIARPSTGREAAKPTAAADAGTSANGNSPKGSTEASQSSTASAAGPGAPTKPEPKNNETASEVLYYPVPDPLEPERRLDADDGKKPRSLEEFCDRYGPTGGEMAYQESELVLREGSIIVFRRLSGSHFEYRKLFAFFHEALAYEPVVVTEAEARAPASSIFDDF